MPQSWPLVRRSANGTEPPSKGQGAPDQNDRERPALAGSLFQFSLKLPLAVKRAWSAAPVEIFLSTNYTMHSSVHGIPWLQNAKAV